MSAVLWIIGLLIGLVLTLAGVMWLVRAEAREEAERDGTSDFSP